ncbi:MAG: VWA domain-containing protein [Candidatus Diapherotrites archaeon]|nr:VWA domain-containing protein [Candidatus Diapherotrites archaeon]
MSFGKLPLAIFILFLSSSVFGIVTQITLGDSSLGFVKTFEVSEAGAMTYKGSVATTPSNVQHSSDAIYALSSTTTLKKFSNATLALVDSATTSSGYSAKTLTADNDYVYVLLQGSGGSSNKYYISKYRKSDLTIIGSPVQIYALIAGDAVKYMIKTDGQKVYALITTKKIVSIDNDLASASIRTLSLPATGIAYNFALDEDSIYITDTVPATADLSLLKYSKSSLTLTLSKKVYDFGIVAASKSPSVAVDDTYVYVSYFTSYSSSDSSGRTSQYNKVDFSGSANWANGCDDLAADNRYLYCINDPAGASFAFRKSDMTAVSGMFSGAGDTGGNFISTFDYITQTITPVSCEIAPSSSTLTGSGQVLALDATCTDVSGTERTCPTLNWSLTGSNGSLANVSNTSRNFTSNTTYGSSTVRVNAGLYSCTASITTVAPPAGPSCNVALTPSTIDNFGTILVQVNYSGLSFTPSTSSRVYCNDYYGGDGRRLVGYSECDNRKCIIKCGPYLYASNPSPNISVSLRDPADVAPRIYCNTTLAINPPSLDFDSRVTIENITEKSTGKLLDTSLTSETPTKIPYLTYSTTGPQEEYIIKLKIENPAGKDNWTPTCAKGATTCEGSFALSTGVTGSTFSGFFQTYDSNLVNSGLFTVLRTNQTDPFRNGTSRTISINTKPKMSGDPEINFANNAVNVSNSSPNHIAVFMLFDVSGSMSEGDFNPDKIVAARVAGKRFIDEVYSAYQSVSLAPEDYVKIGLITFETDVDLQKDLASLTSSYKTSLKNKIDDFEAGGGTNMADALKLARERFNAKAGTDKRIIVVLSDGNPKNVPDNTDSVIYANVRYDNDDEAKDFAEEEALLSKTQWKNFSTERAIIYAIKVGYEDGTYDFLKDRIAEAPLEPYYIYVDPNQSGYSDILAGKYAQIAKDIVKTNIAFGNTASKIIPIRSQSTTAKRCTLTPNPANIIGVAPQTQLFSATCYDAVTLGSQLPCPTLTWTHIITGTGLTDNGNILVSAIDNSKVTFTSTTNYGTSKIKAETSGAGAFNCETTVTTSITGTGNNAECVSYDFGLGLNEDYIVMAPNETKTVSVTMKNIGTTTWTTGSADGKDYRLGAQIPWDNALWGLSRIGLNTGETIAPGASKTFTFQITATPALLSGNTYPSKWKMLKELVEWFPTWNELIGTCGPDHITIIDPCNTAGATCRLNNCMIGETKDLTDLTCSLNGGNTCCIPIPVPSESCTVTSPPTGGDTVNNNSDYLLEWNYNNVSGISAITTFDVTCGDSAALASKNCAEDSVITDQVNCTANCSGYKNPGSSGLAVTPVITQSINAAPANSTLCTVPSITISPGTATIEIKSVIPDPSPPQKDQSLSLSVIVRNYGSNPVNGSLTAKMTGPGIASPIELMRPKTFSSGETSHQLGEIIADTGWTNFQYNQVYTITIKAFDNATATPPAVSSFPIHFILKQPAAAVPEANPLFAVLIVGIVLGIIGFRKKQWV